MRRAAALLALAALVVALVGVGGRAPVGAAATKPRIALLLGDSLTTETLPDFVAPSGWRLTSYAYPGIAPCDWLAPDGLPAHLRDHPAAVLLETAGNDYTACMRVHGALPTQGGTAFVARYEWALHRVFVDAERAGAVVVLLAPPPLLEPHLGPALDEIDAWAFEVEHVFVATAPRLAVSDDGAFALYLPCLRNETAAMGCVDGEIPVRMVDARFHLHFCPYTTDVTLTFTCAVYSSGQERWARATMAVLKALR